MNQYEAMFLFDPTFGATLENCEEEIRRLMERAEAEIILCKKWDERRLAYKIKGRKRGVYVIVYFNAPPGNIVKLERDSKLAENVLRMLVLRAEGLSAESMEKAALSGGSSHAAAAGNGAQSKDKGESKPSADGESKPSANSGTKPSADSGTKPDKDAAADSAPKDSTTGSDDSTASTVSPDDESPAVADSAASE